MNLKKILVLSVLLLDSISSMLEASEHHHCCCTDLQDHADYVVVGVGTAGAVMARRLSDDHKTSVIALHMGKDLSEDPLIALSAGAQITVPYALIGPPLYENGLSTKQPDADNKRGLWVIATPEGGASSINAGAYCRATPELMAKWEAIGGRLWSVERMLAIYKELETYTGKTDNPIFRGKHGPLSVRQNPDPSEISKKFNRAIIDALHVPYVLDYNDPLTTIGSSTMLQYTQTGDNGQFRVSSVNAYLNREVVDHDGHGVQGRKLQILFESKALKTIWDGKKAIGVEYLKGGKRHKVYAEKGVVVCCGLFSSPFLLHSGIGPEKLLNSLEIPVKFNNPNVGQMLAEQPGVRLLFTSNPKDYDFSSTGLFAQISWLAAPHGDSNKRELRIATVPALPGLTGFLLDLCQPKSRGFVTIKSNDPLDPPVVNLGFLNDPGNEDLRLLREGMQIYVKEVNKQLKKIDPTYQLVYPDPSILDSKSKVDEFIKENISSNQHFQSHCRLAPLEEGGVVDSTGHVYGVKNLIVADDSISPLDMDGSPMSSAYLFAENISRILINQEKP